MAYLLTAAFFSGTNKIRDGVERSVPIENRNEAIEAARSQTQALVANSSVKKFDRSLVVLVKENGRAPIWSWNTDRTGAILSEKCEYAP